MPDFSTLCLSSFLLLIVIGLLGIVLNMVGLKPKVVNQEKRLVIYRLGVFRDVVGPGLVLLNRHIRQDRARNQRAQRAESLFRRHLFYARYAVWLSAHLLAARQISSRPPAPDRDLLVHLAQFSDTEREDQIQAKLHEAFLACVPLIEQAHTPKMPKEPTIFDSLVPILPGVPACEQLFSLVLTHLQKTLPTIGAFPDMQQSTVLAVKGINIPPELMRGFSRGAV